MKEGDVEIAGLDPNSKGLANKEMVVDEIGTKKSKKILRQLKNKVVEENRIQSAKEIKSLIKGEVGDIKDELEEVASNEFAREWERKKIFLPDFNLSAKSASKIYDINSIISPHELEVIVPDIRTLHHYARGLLDGINFNKLSEEEQQLKRQHIQYLSYLLKMKKVNRFERPIQEIASEFGIPLICARAIMNKFYTPIKKDDGSSHFSKNKTNDLKMICFILILNLKILNFRLNLKPLMKVLRIDEDQ